jgi:hypothetical protein
VVPTRHTAVRRRTHALTRWHRQVQAAAYDALARDVLRRAGGRRHGWGAGDGEVREGCSERVARTCAMGEYGARRGAPLFARCAADARSERASGADADIRIARYIALGAAVSLVARGVVQL